MADGDAMRAELRILPPSNSSRLPPPIYSNNLRATFTAEDFTLQFGWYAIPALAEPPAAGVVEVEVEPVAQVVIPLNLMRSVIALLQRQLAAYEENFGAVPEHPNKPAWMTEQGAKPE